MLGAHLLTVDGPKSATQVTGKQVTGTYQPQVAGAKCLPNPGARLGWTLPTISKTTLPGRLRGQMFWLTGFARYLKANLQCLLMPGFNSKKLERPKCPAM